MTYTEPARGQYLLTCLTQDEVFKVEKFLAEEDSLTAAQFEKLFKPIPEPDIDDFDKEDVIKALGNFILSKSEECLLLDALDIKIPENQFEPENLIEQQKLEIFIEHQANIPIADFIEMFEKYKR